MKIAERQKAVNLRKEGFSYNDISQKLYVSKGSLSRWLRDMPFVPSDNVVDRRRLSRIKGGQVLRRCKIERIDYIKNNAAEEIDCLTRKEFKLIGAVAYWTEGSKTMDNLAKFTNSDPDFIKFALKWLREICLVPEEKIKIHIRIHNDLNKPKIEEFWSTLTRVPLRRFYKTTFKQSESRGKRANKLQYGIASIIVCDTNLFYRIMGWIKGIINCSVC